MAGGDITRTLTTIFRIVGASELSGGLYRASAAATLLQQTTTYATTASAGIAPALSAAVGPALAVAAAVVVIKGAFDLLSKSLETFGEEQKRLFQASVVFRNLGLQETPDQLRSQVGAASRATGFQRPELLEQAGKLAATGLDPSRIQQALKVIGDAARGTGKDFDQVGNAVERGILGKTRGLAQFGITLQDTGSKATNFANIMRELNLRFEGASEAFKNTLPGSIENFQNSLQHLFSVIGERLAPVVVKVLNALSRALDWIADHIDAVLTAINPLLYGMLKLIGGGDPANAMARVGHGGDPASEKTAREIADNTKKMADSVEIAVLGGTGTEVRGAFGHLQARMALAI